MSDGIAGSSSAFGSGQDLTGRVRAFYERHHFPGIRPTEQDGLILLRRLQRSVTTHGSSRPFRVLDAGCGTGNTVLSLARQLPDARFVGVDLSASSLAIAEASAAALGLDTVTFRQADLRAPLDEDPFDVVICMGVLHHTADMQGVLARLGDALAPQGDCYLWVYGRHGRYRHRLNMKLLAMLLEAHPTEEDPVAFARDFIEHAGQGAPLADLAEATARIAARAEVLRDPAWIADQFLHPHDIHVDLAQILTLVDGAGLSFVEWLGVDTRSERHFHSPALQQRMEALSSRERLLALDLLLKPDRYFVRLRRGAA